ncbi:ATP-binding protein [Sporosarcina pasteurii]|uniref:histidine kinase n=1 Tax=Sporosarcina pasteurii TaxID=1474 RepID=A0A380BEL0_SPOPA|nr:ATP-binding protein [Sporosarcina pasteurii]MDS9470414.1 ATP-binding protein [Sporosarcina pasteurii]SUJ00211.1 Sporulation kinase E [Sporosarcina pasteurii]
MTLEKTQINEDIQFLLKDVNKPLAVVDLSGTIYQANDRFIESFGIGKQSNMKNVIADQSLLTMNDMLTQISDKKRMTLDLQMKLQKDQCSVRVSVLYDESASSMIMLFDLSLINKKRLDIHWGSSFIQSDSLFIISDQEGIIKDMNELSHELFDVPHEHFIGGTIDHVLELFSEKTLNIEKYKQQVAEDGHIETIQQYIHPSEHIRYYKIASFKDDETNLTLTKITDHTEKTMLKQQLAHKGSLLEVGQLAASIAHEIRNPITTLKGFTQLLKATASEETLNYLNVIDDEIQRMELILSEMLFLSKPSSFEKENISVNTLLSDIIRVIYPKATLESIMIVQNFDFGGEPYLLGEEGKLKQVLLNLLKNGLEAMQPGGTLSIYTKKSGQNKINIVIEDTGKGIDENHLKQIFMPYFTTRSSGTGLGLPFVLKTVEDHGGTISVTSELGKGTKFILAFPIIETDKRIPEGEKNEIVTK